MELLKGEGETAKEVQRDSPIHRTFENNARQEVMRSRAPVNQMLEQY